MTGMLASVSNLKEALQALNINVDIIDLKLPDRGALGALDPAEVRTIMTAIDGQCTVSATIGDLPMQPESVVQAVKAMAATGVDYIKIGFFPDGDWPGTLSELSMLATSGLSLIAVLFADTQPDVSFIAALKEAGFKGVMLDTMDKRKGSLTSIMSPAAIKAFVQQAARCNMLCGLAGSLRLEDIPQLVDYHPDYLGFRGALCRQHERTANLDENNVRTIKSSLINACR